MNAGLFVAACGLTAAVSWGVSDFFSAKAARHVGPLLGATLVAVIGAVVYTAVYAVWLWPYHSASLASLGYAVAAGVSMTLGGAAFWVGLASGPVSLVSPISSMYPLVTTAVAVVLFHAELDARELAGIALIMVGLVVVTGLFAPKNTARKVGKGSVWALVAALGWGLGYVLLAQAVARGDWQLVSAVEYAIAALVMVLLVPLIKRREAVSAAAVRKGLLSGSVLAAGIIQMVGFAALSVGIARSTASAGAVVTAISACYPILTIALALRQFGEKVRPVPFVGAAVGIAGVVVLSLG